jgi:hypothetical protein
VTQTAYAVDTPLSPAAAEWTMTQRILFRFAFLYLLLYCLPLDAGRVNILSILPFDTEILSGRLGQPISDFCSWIAIHVLQLSGPATQNHPSGSGDRLLDYVQVLLFSSLAVTGTLVWSWFDRRRREYSALYPWLLLVVRFTLAATMLSYGFAKVLPLQFGSAPRLAVLSETFGEASPMGLLWTFMAASVPYTIFCGLAEVSAGTLLLFRRTSALGALLSAAAMLNVVLLNFCYDVPVKLYSTHLLAMSLFLLLPDLRALWTFFVLRLPAQLKGVCVPPWERSYLRRARLALQVFVVASLVYGQVKGVLDFLKDRSFETRAQQFMSGVWTLDPAKQQSAANPSGTAPEWRQVVVERGTLRVRRADHSILFLQPTFDRGKRRMHVKNFGGDQTGDFTIQMPAPSELILAGKYDGRPVNLALHKSDAKDFLLLTRGFHWINETPFNR